MKLNLRDRKMALQKAKAKAIKTAQKAEKVAEKTGQGALSLTDEALFYEKQYTEDNTETRTQAAALNAPANIFLGARSRMENASEKAKKMDVAASKIDRKIAKNKGRIESLNDEKRLKYAAHLEAKKSKALVQKKKSLENAGKKITKSDVAKGFAAAGVSTTFNELSKDNEEMEKLINKADKARRIPGKAKRVKKAAEKTYSGSVSFIKNVRMIPNHISSIFHKVVARFGIKAAVLFLMIIIIFVAPLMAILGGAIEETEDTTSCPYGDLYYWIRWETGTWEPDEAFASVLGDDGKAYGIQFDYRYDLISFNKWCYEENSVAYKKLGNYITPGSVKFNDTAFASIWKKIHKDNSEDFAEKQKQYAYNKYFKPVNEYLKASGIDIGSRPNVIKGAILSMSWQHGQSAAKSKAAAIIEEDMSDEDVIKALYAERRKMFPSNSARYDEEEEYAISLLYFGDLIGGTVIGSETQKLIVQYATAGNSYGTGYGWCQAWVCAVYRKATGISSSNCCAKKCRDMWATKTGPIPVGAAIYSADSYNGNAPCGCGRDAGHVGIYIGNGKVVSMVNGPTVQSLESWNSWYGYGGWSWNGVKVKVETNE